jgi:hypothetical protein
LLADLGAARSAAALAWSFLPPMANIATTGTGRRVRRPDADSDGGTKTTSARVRVGARARVPGARGFARRHTRRF